MPTISKDTPLFELTLRRYERPHGLSGRNLIRKLCLSLGLLQPGDSRDVIVDILYVLLLARKEKELLSVNKLSKAVTNLRKENKLEELGIAESNIRRQLRRLKDMAIVEKVKSTYRISEFLDLHTIFKNKVQSILIPSTLARVYEYLDHVDEQFS